MATSKTFGKKAGGATAEKPFAPQSPASEARSAKPVPDKAQFANPEPSKTQFAKPEPSKTQFAKPEPSKTQFAKPEPGKAQFAKPEPSEAQSAKPEPSEAQSAKPDLDEAQSAKPVPSEAESEPAPPKAPQADHSLAQRCQDAFEQLVKAGAGSVAETERDALAVQAVLDGTGVNTAGIAHYSSDSETVAVCYQSNTRMLQEIAMLAVSEAPCAGLLLNGGSVNIVDRAAEVCSDDALVSKIGLASFIAEPMYDFNEQVIGFFFVADDKPMPEGGMPLRTFFESIATWLRDGEIGSEDVVLEEPSEEPAESETPRPVLDEQTGLLVDTLQHVGQGIMVFDADLKIIAVNDQTLSLLDVPEDVLYVGTSMPDLINYFGQRGDYGADDRDDQISRMLDIADHRQPLTFERHLANGRVISCNAQPRDNGGYVVSHTDVTEIYKREAQRQENAKLLSDTLNHMEQGLIVYNSALEVLALNEQANAMLNVPKSVLRVGSNLGEFITYCARRGDYGDDDPETAVERIFAVVNRGETYEVERRFDDDRTVVCSAKPRSGGGYIATYTDVSRWRQSEQELDTKTELLSVALDYMDQGLIVYDANFVIQAFNDQARVLLDVPDHVLHEGGSMVTLTEFWITQAAESPEMAEPQVLAVQNQIESGEPFAFEQELPQDVIIACNGRPRRNGGYVVTLVDISEDKRQKRELAEKTAMLEATIQHMDQGLFAFDGDLKILFANERVKMMLGIPREMLQPGECFEEIARLGAKRGGEGVDDVDELIAKARGSEPFSFERKCAGNMIALVRSHPRPHGGHIMTYTDITATKRQQDELSDVSEALREKSEHLDKVFTNMGSGVAMFNADTELVLCNPRYKEIFQLPDEYSLPGVSLADMCEFCIEQGYEEDSDTLIAERLKLAKSRKPAQIKMRMADGRIIHGVHEPLDDGGSMAVYEDVTIRETSEKKLRDYAADVEQQKTLLQTVMENIDQGISLVDGNMVLQAFNPRFLELLEFPPDRFEAGDPMEKFFRFNAERGEYGPGDPDEQVRTRIDLAKKFETHCFVRNRPDGTSIEIKGKPLANGEGFVTTYTDITDILGNEQKVQALSDRVAEADQQLDAAFNSMNQGLAMFDTEHTLVVRNRRYLDIFNVPDDLAKPGATLEEITRYSIEQGYEADPETALERRMEIANMRERAIYRRNMSDGRVLEIIHEPLNNGGSLALYLDVTARENAERKLRDYTLRLEASNRELQDFAYVASHDLQEPLRKIEAFGDRLRTKFGDCLGQEGNVYVDRMQNASCRLRALIDALLDYSRVTSKARPFETVNMDRLAHDVLSDLEATIEEAGATIKLGELPEIDGDEAQLQQLFLNLIGNSLKFRKKDTRPKLKIDAEIVQTETAEGASGELCVLSFADNGIGFDKKYADRIFTIFQRLHSRSEYEGTGVGLATCRKIAERHHGTIVAHSAPGKGARFRVTLPLKQDEISGELVQTVVTAV